TTLVPYTTLFRSEGRTHRKDVEPAHEPRPALADADRRIAVADGIWKSLADGGVVSRLLRRGWHLEPQSRVSDGAGGSLAAVICASELAADHPLRQTGKPALTLGASLVPGHLRMGLEVPGGPPGRDQRLARLVATLGETLDDDAVADALSVLPPIG